MRILKKAAAIVAAMALAVGMTTNCFAATWDSYFGLTRGWAEGADGELKEQSADGWTADLISLGWGGCWGAQVFQKSGSVDIKKGEEYKVTYTISSSKCDKWIYLKIAKGEDVAFGKWVQAKKGKSITVDETFVAKTNADSVYFGIGGEFGDRQDSDKDAEYRYSLAPGGADALDDVDPSYSTVVKCSNFSLTSASEDSEVKEEPKKDADNKKDGTVDTGDFTPIACGAAAVMAASAIVIFARKRETN